MITLHRPKIISRVLPEYNAPLPFSERRALLLIGDALFLLMAATVAFWVYTLL